MQMDKASIIRDAIEYIKSLQDEERRIKAEISNLESNNDFCEMHTTFCSNPKRTRMEKPIPIELLEVPKIFIFLVN